MKIAFCDDRYESIQEVRKIWEECVVENFSYEIDEFNSAEDLLTAYKNGLTYDLLVLDIEMAKISGMEAAKKIRKIDKKVSIIFITAYEQYLREAFEVSAMYYLDKPVDRTKLQMLFHKCIRLYQEAYYALIFLVYKVRKKQLRYDDNKSDAVEEKIKVYTFEILYFESYNHLINVYLISGEMIQTKRKISELEQELRSRNFVRIHKSYIVNVAYIRKITVKSVLLKYKDREVMLELSRKQKKLVETVFMDYRLGDYKT